MAPMIALSIAPKTRPITCIGHRPLEDRVRVDVDQGVTEADQHHRAGGHADSRPRGDSEQWRRPEQHAHSEVEREASPLRKHESHEAADEASDSHHRVEVADSRAAEVEQVESERDDEDEGRARDDGLCAVDADDESQVAVAENGAKPRARVAEKRSALILPLLRHAWPEAPVAGR